MHAITHNSVGQETLVMSWDLAKLLNPVPSPACLSTLHMKIEASKNGSEFTNLDENDGFKLDETNGLLWVDGASPGRYSLRPRVVSRVLGTLIDNSFEEGVAQYTLSVVTSSDS